MRTAPALGSALRRVAAWTLFVGGVSFVAGFVGPIVFAPDANQGPLLGIFITGPLGLVAGFVIGLAREALGRTATPLEVLAGVRARRGVPARGGARAQGGVRSRFQGGVRAQGGVPARGGVLAQGGGARGHRIRRGLAGLAGIVFALEAMRRLPEGVDRPGVASLVVAAALLWYTVRGRMPAWFRR